MVVQSFIIGYLAWTLIFERVFKNNADHFQILGVDVPIQKSFVNSKLHITIDEIGDTIL